MESEADKFFKSLTGFESSYVTASISFLAAKKHGFNLLFDAKVILGFQKTPPPLERLENDFVLGGSWQLESPLEAVKRLIESFSSGELATPIGSVKLCAESNVKPYYSYQPFYRPHKNNQQRMNALTIEFGKTQPPSFPQPDVDWSLRSSIPPFDNLSELMTLLGLDTHANRPSIEIIAATPAMIDSSSVIYGNKANIIINTASKLKKNDVAIGYRAFKNDKAVKREQVAIDESRWRSINGKSVSNLEIEVEPGSFLQCYLIVNGICVHYWWVMDTNSTPNYRHAIYAVFDHSLNFIKSQTTQRDEIRADAREFERALSHLLWLHGFSVINFGTTKKLADGADVIAETPSGRIAIIECTTGVLKSEKVSQLIARTEQLRAQLQKSGINKPTLLPILATTKNQSEVQPDLPDINRKGVVVIAKEDLEALLSNANMPNQAESLFDEAYSAIANNPITD